MFPINMRAIVFALCWVLGRAVSFGGHSCGYLTESHSDRGQSLNEVPVQWRISMLKGFNYPLTPKGKSTLNPPP
jgi:hypothetical protein